MNERFTQALEQMKRLDGDVYRLDCISAALEWDQETYMPDEAVNERAAQVALINGLQHEKLIHPEWDKLFDEMGYSGEEMPQGLSDADAAFLRETYKRRRKKVRVSQSLVEELASRTSLSQSAWARARKDNDFAAFAPHLEKIIELQKEYADAVAPDADPYDTLLDEYEPGASGKNVAAVFDTLADGLRSIMSRINSGQAPDASFLEKSYAVDRQDRFGRAVLNDMGYDFSRGRLDLSTHPFTTCLGGQDVRITTRYDEKLVLSGLFSNIHEGGHGLYEQGISGNLASTLLANGTSLGVHESQSRFWENMIGRSRPFWERWYGEFSSLFPENLNGVSVDAFYKAVNTVKPSLIRVEADEVTYSFHVIARFRLEQALIRGELAVNDLPKAWNEEYRTLLSIDPPSDAQGCMQDVHWSVGLFGYFPTYALGNLYAAQFTKVMTEELGDPAELVRENRTADVLGWLRDNIHVHGGVYLPGELCRRVTRESLNPAYFLEYLDHKYSGVYGYSR